MACPPCGFEGDPKNVERETHVFEARTARDSLAMLAIAGAGAASAPAAQRLSVQFGRVANQLSHAFRHTDRIGLDRCAVRPAIEQHLPSVADQLSPGKPLSQVIDVAGKRIQYTAFQTSQGIVNVGRFHPVP